MTRTRKLAALAAVATLAVSMAFVPAARADTPGIFGYTMTAEANAISFIYDQPSFGLPAPHTFELRNMHAITSIDSGPSAHGLSSILWPGDVVGNAGLALALQLFVADPTSKMLLDCGTNDAGGAFQSLLQGLPTPPRCVPILDAWRQAYDQFTTNYQKNTGQPFDPPPYPVRAETFYPQGPADSKYPVGGGVTMTSHADQSITKAEATIQQAGFPGVISIGTITSSALSGVVDGVAVSQSSTYLGDVNIVGEVHIGAIQTTLTARSDGQKGSVPMPSVEIADMTIHGNPIVVDSKGFHAGTETADPVGIVAQQLIDKYLAPNGISMTVGAPLNIVNGAQASTAADGLVIGLNAKGMHTLVSKMPAQVQQLLGSPSTDPTLSPVLGQLSAFWQGIVNSPTQFDQQLSIVLGSGFAQSAASPTFDFSVPPLPVPPITPLTAPGLGTTLPGTNPFTQTPTPGNRTAPVFGVQVAKVLGVPAGLAVGAWLVALLLAVALNRFAEGAVASEAGEACDVEAK